jgi:hemerythrin-like domain-containing protein
MQCTQIVFQDHIIIRRGLDIVDAMLQKLEDGQRIEIFDATTMLKFLRLFGDQYHQVMEETILFPALLLASPNNAALVQLVSEHGNERTLANEIEEALMSRRGMAFFHSSHELTALLRRHCEREEAVIADLAEHSLSKGQDDEITTEFMTRRTQVESYANFSRLQRRYPPKPSPEPSSPAHELSRARGSASYT